MKAVRVYTARMCTLNSEQQVYKAICFVFKASVYTEEQVYKIICFCVRKSSSLCCISLSINH